MNEPNAHDVPSGEDTRLKGPGERNPTAVQRQVAEPPHWVSGREGASRSTVCVKSGVKPVHAEGTEAIARPGSRLPQQSVRDSARFVSPQSSLARMSLRLAAKQASHEAHAVTSRVTSWAFCFSGVRGLNDASRTAAADGG